MDLPPDAECCLSNHFNCSCCWLHCWCSALSQGLPPIQNQLLINQKLAHVFSSIDQQKQMREKAKCLYFSSMSMTNPYNGLGVVSL